MEFYSISYDPSRGGGELGARRWGLRLPILELPGAAAVGFQNFCCLVRCEIFREGRRRLLRTLLNHPPVSTVALYVVVGLYCSTKTEKIAEGTTTPEGPSTRCLRTLAPNTIKGMVFGTRDLQCWELGFSETIT